MARRGQGLLERGGRMTFAWLLFWIMFVMFTLPVFMAWLDEVMA